MSDKERYLKVIKAIKQKAKEILPPGSTVTLYGSRARGDYKPDSDWDIHILIPGPEKLSLKEFFHYGSPFGEMGWEMNEEINYIVHTYAGWSKRSFLPLYENIEREGIIL